MARLKFYNIDQAEWEYADMAVNIPTNASGITYDNTDSGLTATNVQDAIDEVSSSGGGGGTGITYDLTVSGTATGDCTTDTDWTGATWTANTEVSDMLDKIQTKGDIDIDGALTKSWTNMLNLQATAYYRPVIRWCEIVPALVIENFASQVGITTDGETDGIFVYGAGMGASGEYSEDFTLVIARLANGTTLIYPM